MSDKEQWIADLMARVDAMPTPETDVDADSREDVCQIAFNLNEIETAALTVMKFVVKSLSEVAEAVYPEVADKPTEGTRAEREVFVGLVMAFILRACASTDRNFRRFLIENTPTAESREQVTQLLADLDQLAGSVKRQS